MDQQYLPAFTKIVAVNGKKVPPVVREKPNFEDLSTPPGSGLYSGAGLAVAGLAGGLGTGSVQRRIGPYIARRRGSNYPHKGRTRENLCSVVNGVGCRLVVASECGATPSN